MAGMDPYSYFFDRTNAAGSLVTKVHREDQDLAIGTILLNPIA